jgi:hypothetical protein
MAKKKIGEIIGDPLDVESLVNEQQSQASTPTQTTQTKQPSKALTFAKGVALGFGNAAKQAVTHPKETAVGLGKALISPVAAMTIFPEAQYRATKAGYEAIKALVKGQGLQKAADIGAETFGDKKWLAEKYFGTEVGKTGAKWYEVPYKDPAARQIIGQAMTAPLLFAGGGEAVTGGKAAVGASRVAKAAQAAKTGMKVGAKFGLPFGVEQTYEEGDIKKLPQNIALNVGAGMVLGGVTGGATGLIAKGTKMIGTPEERKAALEYIAAKGTKMRDWPLDREGNLIVEKPGALKAGEDWNLDKQGNLILEKPRVAPTEYLQNQTTGKMEGSQRNLNIDSLISHEGAPDLKSVETYKKEIRAGNPVEPIKIIKEGDKWGIEDGKHRYQAYKELGYTTVPTVEVGGKEQFRLKDNFQKLTGMAISDQQEKQIIELDKKFFGKNSNIKITGQILTPQGQEALGSYRDGMIKILRGQADAADTYYHEAVHKYLDVFTSTQEQADLLLTAQKKFGTTSMSLTEEKLAEDFINYASGQQKASPFKALFDTMIARIKSYFGNEDEIKTFYNDILKGKAKTEGEMPTAGALQMPDWAKKEAGLPTAPAEAIKVSAGQLPVGEGEVKTSKLAQRVAGRLENLDQQTKDSLPTYNVMNKKDQIARDASFVESNQKDAMSVLKGEIGVPAGNTYNGIAIAMEEKAKQDGDAELARNLSSLYSTRAGQEISLLSERDQDSPVRYISDVQKARIEARGGQETIAKSTRAETAKIQSEVTKVTAKKQDWSSFVESLRCHA